MNLFRRKPVVEEAEIPDPTEMEANTAEALFNRGMLFYSSQKYERAIADFKQALNLEPEQIDPHYGLGLVYRMLGQSENAIASFSKVLELLEEGRMDETVERKMMLMRISKAHINSLKKGETED
jgi:tetratricopeptide (TPR) repeat protein